MDSVRLSLCLVAQCIALRRVIMIVTSAGVVSCWYQVLRAHLAVSGLQSASDTQSVDSRNKPWPGGRGVKEILR